MTTPALALRHGRVPFRVVAPVIVAGWLVTVDRARPDRRGTVPADHGR
jgi:hypothetical protein